MGEASKANIVADIRTRELGRDTAIRVEDAGETRIIHHFTGDRRDWFQVLGPDEAARLAAALARPDPQRGQACAGAGTVAVPAETLRQWAIDAGAIAAALPASAHDERIRAMAIKTAAEYFAAGRAGEDGR